MNKIKQYILFAFIIENLCVQTRFLSFLSLIFFYVFLGVGAFFLFDSDNWSKTSREKYWWMYVLMAVYVFYEFIIGVEYISSQTLLYLIAKITTFFIIITSLNHNLYFYEHKILILIPILVSLLIGYGIFQTGFNFHSSEERLRLGFGNSNSTGAYGALSIGALMFYTKGKKWNWKYYLIVLLGLYAVLAAGSRAGIAMLFIFIFCRYNISFKTISVVAAFAVIAYVVLPKIGIETVGIERFTNTVTGTEGTNRDVEREATLMMIKERPYTGWGFYAENQGAALDLSELGSHNGYLDTAKWMGIPTAVCWFLPIFIATIIYIVNIIKKKVEIDFYFTMVIGLLLKSMYEGLFTGVHELETNLFFVALAIISSRVYLVNQNYYGKGNIRH